MEVGSSDSSGDSYRSIGSSRENSIKAIRFENPFSLKVGQVFTGFGIGCGLGIGVGRPINLGAVPMLHQVMSATRGATDAFSGVSRHVNSSLRKFGAKHIEVGVGCGVGFGHGFGVGLAVKPGVLHQTQSCLAVIVTKMMMKAGLTPNFPGSLPLSFPSSMGMPINVPSTENPVGNAMQIANKPSDGVSHFPSVYGYVATDLFSDKLVSESPPVDKPFRSRTEEVVGSFLQSPIFKEENTGANQMAGRLHAEHNVLQMILKHQRIIEELLEENEKLRIIMVEELKVPAGKLTTSASGRSQSPCTDCFECRRKQKRR